MGGECPHQSAFRQAIIAQHNLGVGWPLRLDTCSDCGTPYLMQEIWQPIASAGELACPHCGSVVANQRGGQALAVYWYLNGQAKAPTTRKGEYELQQSEAHPGRRHGRL